MDQSRWLLDRAMVHGDLKVKIKGLQEHFLAGVFIKSDEDVWVEDEISSKHRRGLGVPKH